MGRDGRGACRQCGVPLALEVAGRGEMIARAAGLGVLYGAGVGAAIGLLGIVGLWLVLITVFIGALVGAVIGLACGLCAGLVFAACHDWIAEEPARADYLALPGPPALAAVADLVLGTGWVGLGWAEGLIGIVGAVTGAVLAHRVVTVERRVVCAGCDMSGRLPGASRPVVEPAG